MRSIMPRMSFNSDGLNYGVQKFVAREKTSLANLARSQLQINDVQINELLHLGAVYVDDVRLTEGRDIEVGSLIRVHTSPRRFSFSVDEIDKLIHFQNSDFIVINKPSGIPVHALVDNCQENLVQIFSRHLALNLQITHRLYIPTQ